MSDESKTIEANTLWPMHKFGTVPELPSSKINELWGFDLGQIKAGKVINHGGGMYEFTFTIEPLADVPAIVEKRCCICSQAHPRWS